MTWNADSAQNIDMVDVTSTISNRVNMQSNTSKSKKIRDQFSSSHGNTYGDIEFPEVAPLVFPALDMLADDSGNEAKTKKEKLKKAKNFASEYFDRRAVAKYVNILKSQYFSTNLIYLCRQGRIQTACSPLKQVHRHLPHDSQTQTTQPQAETSSP